MNEKNDGLYQSSPFGLYQNRPDEEDIEFSEGDEEHEKQPQPNHKVVESSHRSQNDTIGSPGQSQNDTIASRGPTLTSRVTSASALRLRQQEEMAEQRKRFLCIAFGVIVLWCIIAAIIGGIVGSVLG
jgi:hypothetical protein